MSNNLQQAKKDLKAFAKRAKNVKYTESLLFSYLITGMITFSIGLNTSSNVLYERMNKELVMSADKTRTAIKKKKKANEEAIEDLNLELIQLMEQGDQVVKSKWASWQFGSNTFILSSNGAYKGRGDKAAKYPFNGIFTRGNWADNGILSTRRRGFGSAPIHSSNVDTRSYGLASLLHVQEPEVEIQIMANVRPKSVTKEEISINPQIDMPREVVRPNINLSVTSPITAPNIKFPNVKPVNIDIENPVAPSEPETITPPTISIGLATPQITLALAAPQTPNINIRVTPPDITPLTIAKPSEVDLPTVTPPTINPVDFSIDPTGDAQRYLDLNTIFRGGKVHNVTKLTDKNYITRNGTEGKTNGELPSGYTINVKASNNRAIVLDEAKNNDEFYNKGTINLEGSQNVALDIQGTHVANGKFTVINAGTIHGKTSIANPTENQVAFGFNNPDASTSSTLTTMSNGFIDNKSGTVYTGTITLDSDRSAAMQLKPEDAHYWQPVSWGGVPITIGSKTPNNYNGKVAMKAENNAGSTIELNGKNSFGITTVFNPGLPQRYFNTSYESLKAQ